MKALTTSFLILLLLCFGGALADGSGEREILVTFDNSGAKVTSAGAGAPYRNRKRYSISARARQSARQVAAQYSLEEIDDWPIRSLGLYCSVFRIPADLNRDEVIEALQRDTRVESVQPLQRFETGMVAAERYDDTYAGLQYVLDALDIGEAHQHATGVGVRVAIVDSNVDSKHEDLDGQLRSVSRFEREDSLSESTHGTAVASVIGARANNSRGIVGVAPDAIIEAYVACWSGQSESGAVCDSFSLSKALDAMLENPPEVVNLSLNGPPDPLVSRLIRRAHDIGIVIVAAQPNRSSSRNDFPASMPEVIGVGAWSPGGSADITRAGSSSIRAPGDRILVASPRDEYEFRSGTSLAAAHVTGLTALLLSIAPDIVTTDVTALLQQSQAAGPDGVINACELLRLRNSALDCGADGPVSKNDPERKHYAGVTTGL